MEEYSKDKLRKLRKALEAINNLTGIALPSKLGKQVSRFQSWLIELDEANEGSDFLGNLFFGWIRRRKRRS